MHEGLAEIVYRAAARYRGEETFRYLRQYQGSQWFDAQALAAYRTERLADLMAYLRQSIPFYRDLNPAGFSDLPVVGRLQMKEPGFRFVNPDLRRAASIKKTSGSTGEPVMVFRDSEGLAREQAITWRGYGWAGIRPGARQARFWGNPLQAKARWTTRGKDLLLNRRRFPVFNYTEATLEKYLREFLAFSPTFVYGYVSALADFARFLLARGRPLDSRGLKAVITTSEVLSDEARILIESAFGARVFNEYGCSELGTIAHECAFGRLHVNAETLHLEVVGEDGEIREEGRGRVLVTEFHNRVQPLVRYELGDLADISREECACGRALPVIREIHGKSYDIIFGPAGRKYFPEYFSYIFKDIQGDRDRIRQFQVVQVDRELQVNIVRGKDFREDVEAQFHRKLSQEFGAFFACTFAYPEQIPKEKSGKFRQVKRVSPMEPFPVG